jgi:hypothetical protein
VKSIKKLLVTLNILLCPFTAYAASGQLKVSCHIQSEGYLAEEPINLLTDAYTLSDVPFQAGGRHLIYQNDQYELWVKTHSYLRQDDHLTITAFSVVLIDLPKKLMAEAASSTPEGPRHATLTLHSLSDDAQLTDRLIISCVESM